METLISDLRELPSAVSAELQALREMDRVSRDLADQISTDEAKLFQDIADAAKIDSGFDEAPFKERFQSVTHRKQDLVALLDEQTKKAQAIYNKVDLKISIFGTLEHTFCVCGNIKLFTCLSIFYTGRCKHEENLAFVPAI